MFINKVKVISTSDVDRLTEKVNEFIKGLEAASIVDIQYQSAFNGNTNMMQYSAMIRYSELADCSKRVDYYSATNGFMKM